MTLGDFYRLIFRRTFEHSLDRPRKIGFGLTLAGATFQYRYPPSEFPVVGRLLILVWLIPLGLIVGSWVYRFIRAPYELYRDKADALEAALPVKMAAERRASIQNTLVTFLEKGERFTSQLERWHSGGMTHDDLHAGTDMDIGQDVIQWIAEVETYMRENLEPMYRTRFASNAYFPTEDTMGLQRNRFMPGLKARCANLAAIITDFSSAHSQ